VHRVSAVTVLAAILGLVAPSLGCGSRSAKTSDRAAQNASPASPAPRETRDSREPKDSGPPAASAAPRAEAIPERVWVDGQAMGTKLLFAGYTNERMSAEDVREAFALAIVEVKRIEALMTTWRDDAELSRVNREAGKSAVQVSDETFGLIKESIRTSEASEGTFDITFESLHGLWKFDQDLDPHPPTIAQVKAKLSLVNFRHIKLSESDHKVMLDKPGVRISLGGIAKGYAVDKAVALLDKAGLTSYFIQAGGDLFARGKKPDGQGWLAGIRDPRGPDGKSFAMLPISDHAFSTAGDYERSYVVGGRRYHHIIDPRTGFPATASRSVTVWAKTALEADALDDAVFILGPEKGLKLIESRDGAGAVIVDAQNKVWISERLKNQVRVSSPPTDAI
jgi:thiamine biosynthesis lipoprotein